MELRSLYLQDEQLHFINQTKLPFEEEWVVTDNYERIALAIERLEIRGAPAIGIAAAYALALCLKSEGNDFGSVYTRLKSTRPTAVNLIHGLDVIQNVYTQSASYVECLQAAVDFHEQDITSCRNIALHGAKLLAAKKHGMTICNTGAFAVGGEGTALGVIKELHKTTGLELLTACETRPLLQGLRLTSYEAFKAGLPFRMIVDSAAAYYLSRGDIDFVITGADRIAANGDSANKIGTFMLAVLAKEFNVPFYIAAPMSTIDPKTKSGADIVIELRSSDEVRFAGSNRIAPEWVNTENPAFDVTPSSYISGIITDHGVFQRPYTFLSHEQYPDH